MLICGAEKMKDISGDRTRVIRKYKKSSVPRLRWTPELHDHFVKVVCSLGGRYKATPKRIMQMMGVRGLKISHIKSHLQMYRSMKESIGLTAIKNYQEQGSDFITLVPLRQVSQGKWKITTKSENLFYHEYQVQGEKGSTGSTRTKSDNIGEIPKAKIELEEASTSECSWHGPINLDLTMSFSN